jgi:lipoprotein-anchoring transpeptidase ErfK/SrfK
LASGAKTEVWTKPSRMWPINIAARKSDVKMMRALLGKDPDVEQRRIVVDLSDQKAWIFDSSGLELYSTKISSGKSGFSTPTGTFAITNKYKTWTSTLYDASMPFFQRLSCGDFGFHQGNVPGYPASHGCIRVPYGNANKLFTLTELGDRVEIRP